MVSDLTSACGNYLKTQPTIISTIQWPRQPEPSKQAWQQWKRLYKILANDEKLRKPLGSWTNWKHRKWRYTSTDTTIYDSHTERRTTEVQSC
ncbi:hypothetical protein TI05_13590 [Achromatium sp. WMS3]|nr:hypothetical protein TI05_13590 [Achromatium sp. WMS3]